MVDNKSLTNTENNDKTNTEIIESWDRNKYPRFTDYLDSEDYKENCEKEVG